MNKKIAFFMMAASLFCLSSCAQSDRLQSADRAAMLFHKQYDAGQYHEIYVNAFFRAVSEAEFMRVLDQTKRTAGQCGPAIPEERNHQYDFRSEIETMKYIRRCAKGDIREEIVFEWLDNQWRLVRYHSMPATQ
jgi:hypothetical protein